MSDEHWNPWKMTAIGMALVVATALITGLVVANWGGKKEEAKEEVRPARSATATRAPARHVVARPSAADVETCNQLAKAEAGSKTEEVVKDALIGGAIGAGVGAAGGAIAGGGREAGRGAAIGGVVGAAGGTLYGLNEAKKNDARYIEAYRRCMAQRGHVVEASQR